MAFHLNHPSFQEVHTEMCTVRLGCKGILHCSFTVIHFVISHLFAMWLPLKSLLFADETSKSVRFVAYNSSHSLDFEIFLKRWLCVFFLSSVAKRCILVLFEYFSQPPVYQRRISSGRRRVVWDFLPLSGQISCSNVNSCHFYALLHQSQSKYFCNVFSFSLISCVERNH